MADLLLDEPVTIRDMLALIHLVRDTKPRDGLRALEDAMLDLAARAGSVPAVVVQIP